MSEQRTRLAITLVCIAAIGVGAYAWPRSQQSQQSQQQQHQEQRSDRDPSKGPFLVLTRQSDAGAGGGMANTFAPSSSLQTAALDAVLVALDPPARAGLTVALTETNMRLEARANPLSEDLEGGDPEEGMREWSRGRSSLLRAGTELARASWCAADGLCVVVLGTCPNTANARCVPVWGPASSDGGGGGGDPHATRARFMAWPFAGSLILRVSNKTNVEPAAAALRAAGRAESSTIALVVTSHDHAALERDASGRDLRAAFKRWRTLSAIVKSEERGAQRDDGTSNNNKASSDAASAAAAIDPTLKLADDELLVVPKLSSLVAPATFVAEVSRIAADAHIVVTPAR